MKLAVASVALFSSLAFATAPALAQNQRTSFSGRIHQVWEDGFQLSIGDRSITVDSYDICGDSTTRYIRMGDHVTVTGEFDGGAFDAFAITKVDGTKACQ